VSLIHETAVVGPLQCNCALLACPKTLEAVLIDPGDEPQKIIAMVEARGVKVKYLLHTHAHFDHIGATGALKEKWGALPCLHQADEQIYNNLPLQGKLFGMQFGNAPAIEKYFEDEEVLVFGEQKLKVIHTPGHSPGGVCFQLVGDDERVFSGDTLFHQSIGRSDLWGGDERQLVKSIRDRLLVLRDETEVFPGHGPKTLIGVEKRSNPFLA
jgi:hydroxyacylglutathione hydrolase